MLKEQFVYIIMPKHKKGNNNTRRMAPKRLPIKYADKEFSQEYGVIAEVLGNCHFKINTNNNETKTASLCGTIKRSGKVRISDLVLIEPLTESSTGKYQIVFRYTPDQQKTLENEGHLIKIKLPDLLNELNITDDEDESTFAFESDEKNKQLEQKVDIINDNFIDDI
jgi:initiation factor 1A